MKLMTCPMNGTRPISEFAYWGEIRPAPVAAGPERHSKVHARGSSPRPDPAGPRDGVVPPR